MSILTCQDLTKRYSSVLALDHIGLAIEPGRIVGLLGPNGSGKSTFIKLATGLLQPTEGKIRLDGHAPGKETKAIVSYLPDREYLPDWMKAGDLFKLYQGFFADFDIAKARDLLKDLSIDEGMVLKKMSKGTREKVRLVLTMSRRAKIYLLDEPIAGVDPAARDSILSTILGNYQEDALVLISTHLIADVESILDEAIFLKQGKILLHKPTDQIREETGLSVDRYFREVFAGKRPSPDGTPDTAEDASRTEGR